MTTDWGSGFPLPRRFQSAWRKTGGSNDGTLRIRGTTGHAKMVTDDKSGKKLPPHSFGEWVFSRTINVAGETHLRGGVNCTQVLANVVKDGFHHWPELESDCPPNRRPLGRQLCLPISPTSRKIQAPSCSHLLTLSRPPARLRARGLLRPNPKLRGNRVPRQKSPAPGALPVSQRAIPYELLDWRPAPWPVSARRFVRPRGLPRQKPAAGHRDRAAGGPC